MDLLGLNFEAVLGSEQICLEGFHMGKRVILARHGRSGPFQNR